MRIIVLTALLFLTVAANAQQRANTFEKAAKNNLTVKQLDKQYANALDADSNKAAFRNTADQKKFIGAYTAMLTDLNTYLHKHDFKWEQPTRIVHRIYFEPDGTVDYYLLNLSDTKMNSNKKEKLISLLNQFIAGYKLKTTADKKFAQCGPAIYQD